MANKNKTGGGGGGGLKTIKGSLGPLLHSIFMDNEITLLFKGTRAALVMMSYIVPLI